MPLPQAVLRGQGWLFCHLEEDVTVGHKSLKTEGVQGTEQVLPFQFPKLPRNLAMEEWLTELAG